MPTMETLNELTARLERLRTQFVLGSIGSALLAGTTREDIYGVMGWVGDRRARTIEMSRRLGGSYRVDVEEATASYDPLFGAHEAIESWAHALALTLGQGLKEHDYLDNRPLFEFVRHVRNAVAHGGTFDIRKMVGPAEFSGFTITRDLNGTPLSNVLSPGDMVALYDEVVDALRTY